MSDREPRLLIEDILESADKIKQYTADLNFDSFVNDSKTVDAVIRNFEIIGEASRRLPEGFKDKHETVDWFRIIGFRNRIVHDYMGIDYMIVWEIISKYLDQLIADLNKILEAI
jgi:uncharacterized protein with HEPN domain